MRPAFCSPTELVPALSLSYPSSYSSSIFTACGTTFYALSGVLKSPAYAPNLTCEYYIRTPTANNTFYMVFEFVHFQLKGTQRRCSLYQLSLKKMFRVRVLPVHRSAVILGSLRSAQQLLGQFLRQQGAGAAHGQGRREAGLLDVRGSRSACVRGIRDSLQGVR